MQEKPYYLGLDMGTNSVGWAVTDQHYNLLKAKGKDLWGIREFIEADTSVERRTHRISRRRRQREQARIGLLNDYFHDAIIAIDPSFFQRLENSKYHLEDKDQNVRYKYNIFNDPDYTDADYYTQYPTIYHLRKELLENPKPHDVRLVYLALLNMFKHRGHFLNSGISDGNNERSLKDAYINFAISVSELTEDYFNQDVDYSTIEGILWENNLNLMSDVPRPFKQALPEYNRLEDQLLDMIYTHFLGSTLDNAEQEILKDIDNAMLWYDLTYLLHEKQPIPKPQVYDEPDYTVRPFTDVEEEYLQIYQTFIQKLH